MDIIFDAHFNTKMIPVVIIIIIIIPFKALCGIVCESIDRFKSHSLSVVGLLNAVDS